MCYKNFTTFITLYLRSSQVARGGEAPNGQNICHDGDDYRQVIYPSRVLSTLFKLHRVY